MDCSSGHEPELASHFNLKYPTEHLYVGTNTFLDHTTRKRLDPDHVGMMNTDFYYTMDYYLRIRVASQYQIGHLPVVLANERHYANSKTVTAPELGVTLSYSSESL
jgi:hypothetical protein